MSRLFATGIVSLCLTLCATPLACAQFISNVNSAPEYVQDGFGSAGDELPFNGLEYCCPTSVAMTLAYLGSVGFSQIGPANPTEADGLNLTRVMSGLMQTSEFTGTGADTLIAGAVSTYLNAEGISSSNFSVVLDSAPTLATLGSLDQAAGTVVDLGMGFYYNTTGTTYVRDHGHMVFLLNQGVDLQGNPAPSTIIVNNPEPHGIEGIPDIPSNVLQSWNMVPTPTGLTAGKVMIDPSQLPDQFYDIVVQFAMGITVSTNQLSFDHPTPATWTWSANQILNPEGGTLPVLAPINSLGVFGLTVASPGAIDMENTDVATGANNISGATWESDIASGTPFGTGSTTLASSTLGLAPTGSGGAIRLAVAGGSQNPLTFSGADQINLNRGSNNSLSLTLGGNTSGTTQNLTRSGNGTLVIAPASGNANLGSLESLVVNGSASNAPAITNGIVTPYIVAQNNDAGASGDFLTYGSSGFVLPNYTQSSTTPIASASATSVYDDEQSQTLISGATASVYALKVGPTTLGGDSTTSLNVGPQTSGQAGIILNGGTIAAGTLNLGSAEGLVYSSNAGGTISSVVQGTNGLTTFGPGALTLTGANTYIGTTNINSGTLIAANTSGSATGGGNVNVLPNATLQVNGPSGSISSTVTVNSGGMLLMNGGTVNGNLTMNAGSYLVGSGTINGPATINGNIGGTASNPTGPQFNGVENLHFSTATGNIVIGSGGNLVYEWRLNALDDNPADAGVNWSLLSISDPGDVGAIVDMNYVSFDFGTAVPDPNSGNPFWDERHTWLFVTDTAPFGQFGGEASGPVFSQGTFYFVVGQSLETLSIEYVPVPEPARLGVLGMAIMFLQRRRRRI